MLLVSNGSVEMEGALQWFDSPSVLVEAYFWTLFIVWCPIKQKLLDQN